MSFLSDTNEAGAIVWGGTIGENPPKGRSRVALLDQWTTSDLGGPISSVRIRSITSLAVDRV